MKAQTGIHAMTFNPFDADPDPDCQTKREHDESEVPDIHFVRSHRPSTSERNSSE